VARQICDRKVAVSILSQVLLRNECRQVVHTHVPLSPSSIIWHQYKTRWWWWDDGRLSKRCGLPSITLVRAGLEVGWYETACRKNHTVTSFWRSIIPVCLGGLNTKSDKLILRKIINIVASRHQMSYFEAKMHKIRFRLGSTPDPAVGAR